MLFATLRDALEIISIGDQEHIKLDIFNISSDRGNRPSRNLQYDYERITVLEHANEVIQDKK